MDYNDDARASLGANERVTGGGFGMKRRPIHDPDAGAAPYEIQSQFGVMVWAGTHYMLSRPEEELPPEDNAENDYDAYF